MSSRIKNSISKKWQNEKQQKIDVDVNGQIENETETEREGESGSENDKVSSLEKFLQIQGIVYNHKFKKFFQITKRNIDILL